ncbi:MAG: hypothetical protein HUJ74_02625 [Lachnospiraceae bacterium]|nr:hypothetical protein [Lachnospiraceae bacterium]
MVIFVSVLSSFIYALVLKTEIVFIECLKLVAVATSQALKKSFTFQKYKIGSF